MENNGSAKSLGLLLSAQFNSIHWHFFGRLWCGDRCIFLLLVLRATKRHSLIRSARSELEYCHSSEIEMVLTFRANCDIGKRNQFQYQLVILCTHKKSTVAHNSEQLNLISRDGFEPNSFNIIFTTRDLRVIATKEVISDIAPLPVYITAQDSLKNPFSVFVCVRQGIKKKATKKR